MKYLKIYDRSHTILDEIDNFNGLQYSWTLNGFGKARFSIGLENIKCTEENFKFNNHVEIWEESTLIWGGQIVNRDFADSKLNVNCYGYLSLLDKRRLRSKSYVNQAYGDLFTEMLTDINTLTNTGVTMGAVATGSLKTQRTVTNEDFLLKKLQEFCEDSNYDIDVDAERKINFYLRKGSAKPNYMLEYGGDADNILVAPTLSQSSLNIANAVYSEIVNESGTLTSLAEDGGSQLLYGLQESVYSGNDSVILQNTLDNNTISELQRVYLPTNSISLKIKDSSMCPFADMEVGDSIPVSLRPYWGFTDTLRILEISHDEDSKTRDIVVGETLYRPVPATIKQYRK